MISQTPQKAVAGSKLSTIVTIFCLTIFALQFYFLLNSTPGFYGIDAGYFLRQFIEGKIFFLKNGLAVPHFTPAHCGGTPYFADPQVAFYSLTQLIFLLFKPTTAYTMAILTHYGIGLWGMYLLAKRGFNLSREATLFAVLLFATNGPVIERAMAGQFSWLTLAYVPWLFWAILDQSFSWLKSALIAGFVAAAIIHGGGHYVIVMAGLGTLPIVGLALLINQNQLGSFVRYLPYKAIASLGVTLLLAAPKLYLGAILVKKNIFDVASAPTLDPLTTVQLIFSQLFNVGAVIPFSGPRTSYDCSLLLGSAFLIPLSLFNLGKKLLAADTSRSQRFWGLGGLLILFSTLVIVYSLVSGGTLFTEGFHTLDFLKRLREPHRFTQILCIPLCIFLAIPVQSLSQRLAFLLIVVTGVLSFVRMQNFHDAEHYMVQATGPLEQWEQSTSHAALINYSIDSLITQKSHFDALEPLLKRASSINCYSTFDYPNALQTGLVVGPTNQNDGNSFNIRNPTCLLFPDENTCNGPTRISVDHEALFNQLRNFKPVSWQRSKTYALLSQLTQGSLCILAVWGFALLLKNGSNFLRRHF